MIVSRETVRSWESRFGRHFADCIKRDRPGAADKWHLDEVVIPINGRKFWLWRAVDANGPSRDIAAQCTAGQWTNCAATSSSPRYNVLATQLHQMRDRAKIARLLTLMMSAQGKWRKLDGRNRLPEIIEGVEFRDGLRHVQVAA